MTDQSHPIAKRDKEMIPRILVNAMFGIALFALALVAFATLTDRPLVGAPNWAEPIRQETTLILDGDRLGNVKVLDASGKVLADLDSRQSGFVAVMNNMLARERMLKKAPALAPIRVVEYESGRTAVLDDVTGWNVQLKAFGKDSKAAFTRYLPQPLAEAS